MWVFYYDVGHSVDLANSVMLGIPLLFVGAGIWLGTLSGYVND